MSAIDNFIRSNAYRTNPPDLRVGDQIDSSEVRGPEIEDYADEEQIRHFLGEALRFVETEEGPVSADFFGGEFPSFRLKAFRYQSATQDDVDRYRAAVAAASVQRETRAKADTIDGMARAIGLKLARGEDVTEDIAALQALRSEAVNGD